MQTNTKLCKHGLFTFYEKDAYVGKSLDLYGEFSEDEVEVFKKCLLPTDLAIEVGANIGALTVPMSRCCEQLMVFEPVPENYQLLMQNLIQNGCENVHPYQSAIGSSSGSIDIQSPDELSYPNYGAIEVGHGSRKAPIRSLDKVLAELKCERKIKFVKIDVEGHELEVLKGAEDLLSRDMPILYVENDRQEKSAELVGWLIDHGYLCYLHQPPLFNRLNHNNVKKNVFGEIVSINMLCVHEDSRIEIDNLDRVNDHRIDPNMHRREYHRLLRKAEREPGNLDNRVDAAHFAGLEGDLTTARRMIAENFASDPNHLASRTIQGLLDLQAGNFKNGWPAYELRHEHHKKIGAKFGFRNDGLSWDGWQTDEVVLIHNEQGFGDSIMFVRFMDEVLKRAPNAILQVQPQLYELFEISNLVPEGKMFRSGRFTPPYTKRCSLPSLPATLGLKEEGQLTRGQYLWSDRLMVDTWTKRNVPRIGVCLKGGTTSERFYSRDMDERLIEPLTDKYGQFMSLENHGQWESFADSAAAISSLDQVLTVDTSVAHLCGALGIPTALLLSTEPDWRWQRDRGDSPWYPSMKIFRQKKFMDWSNVIEEIDDHLGQQRQEEAAE